MIERLCVAVQEHQRAFEDLGWDTRSPDEALWSVLDQVQTVEQLAAAVSEHRRRVGLYALGVDEELWSAFDEVLR